MLRKKYNTPVCPHCNQMITVAAKFCSECGGKLDNADGQEQTDSIEDAEFKMFISDTIFVPGRGQVCTGKINCGTVRVGDTLDVEYQGGISVCKNLTVAGIEKYRDSLDEAVKDDIVSILLRGDSIEKIKTNMLITKRKESE
jgi:elongation factor Tu